MRVLSLPMLGLEARPGGVRLLARWQNGAGRASWRLRLVGRKDGRWLTRTIHGAGPGHTVRRTMRVPPAWRGVAFRATFRATDETRTVSRVLMLRVPRR